MALYRHTDTEKLSAGRRHSDLSDKGGAKAATFILKSEAPSQQRGLLDMRIDQQGRCWTHHLLQLVTGDKRTF